MVLSYYTVLQSVAAILQKHFMVHVMLFHMLNVLYSYVKTFQNMCAVLNMAVFSRSLISRFPGMLLRNFLNDFQMVPVPLIITGITFTFHMNCYFFCKADYLLLLFYFIFVKNWSHMYRSCVCHISLICNLKALHQCHICTCTLRTAFHTWCVGMPVIHVI